MFKFSNHDGTYGNTNLPPQSVALWSESCNLQLASSHRKGFGQRDKENGMYRVIINHNRKEIGKYMPTLNLLGSELRYSSGH